LQQALLISSGLLAANLTASYSLIKSSLIGSYSAGVLNPNVATIDNNINIAYINALLDINSPCNLAT
jgi:hypothetical protein